MVELVTGAWLSLRAGFSLDLFNWMGEYHYFPRILAFFNNTHREFGGRVTGRILSEASMRELVDGRTHPRRIINSVPPDRIHWADDIRDIRRRYPIGDSYSKQYGEWFVKIQDAIAPEIEETHPPPS